MSRMFRGFSGPLVSLVKFQYGVLGGEDSSAAAVRRFFALQSAVADREVVCRMETFAKKITEDNNKVK